MKNKGLFSTLFIESIRSQAKLDDAGTGRMATLSHDWKEREAASEKSVWKSFIKQGLAYLEFVPQESDKRGVYPLFEDYGYSNCVSVLFLTPPDSGLDDNMVGRFWPGKLIAELKRRKLNWGILTDGAAWRLYSTKSSRPYEDYVELDLEGVLESSDESEYALFERFFHRDSFVPEVPDDEEETEQARAEGVYKCRLDRDREASENVLEEKVKTPFLNQVDEVLQYLCNGFIIDTPRRGEEYTEEERKEIFESAVKLLYRCLFLFYAESRCLLPSDAEKSSDYEKHSIKALCREAHKFQWGKRKDTNQYDLWKHLKGLANAVNFGDPEYGIKGYDGGLFDDEEEKFLGEHKLRNDFLARALYLLFYVEPYNNSQDDEYEIPYEDLEVRHLGELYENILEYTVLLAPADRIRRRSKKGVEILLASETKKQPGETVIKKGDVYFGESALERKQSGSYYTPESLVRFLNAKAIVEPLRERFNQTYRERFDDLLEQISSGYDESTKRGAWRSAVSLIEQFVYKEVLNFKACDPAMGSGHFLVDGSNQLTGLIVELFSEIPNMEGETGSVSSIPNDWRRLITRHCLYGVDLNPLAVNLAKLSLWLNCFAQNHKLTFLDHHLRCGNSLIGIRSIKQLEARPERGKEKEKKSKVQKLPFEDISKTFSDTKKIIADISAIDEDDTGRQKEVFEKANEIARETLSPLADLYTAYLMDSSIKEDDYINLFSHLAKGNNSPINDKSLQKIIEQVKQYSIKHHFFHWPLEFPEVFSNFSDIGFNATVGNPPWDVLEPNTQEFYILYDPDFRKYNKQTALRRIKEMETNNQIIEDKWIEYENSFYQSSSYFKELEAYAALTKGKIDLYKVFLERSYQLLKRTGILGIVMPSGFYTDQSCKPLRELFFNKSKVNFIYCFENRWPTVFRAVDSRFKFITFSAKKDENTELFKCAFMEHDPERLPLIHSRPVLMTMQHIKAFSPDTLSPLEVTSTTAIEIISKCYKNNPSIKNYKQIQIYQEINATSDSKILNTEHEGMPLWEGKNIWQFDSEFANPRYWVQEDVAEKYLKQKYRGNKDKGPNSYRLSFRGVAAATNERTLIATILPPKYLCEVKCTCINMSTDNSRNALSLNAVSLLNSFVYDFCIRYRVTCNVNIFHIEQLPLSNELLRPNMFLISRCARLICTSDKFSALWRNLYSEEWKSPDIWYPNNISNSYGPKHEQHLRKQLADSAHSLEKEWNFHCGVHERLPDRRDTGDRAQLRAEIDAYVAHLYGLSRDDFSYILDTFPVLKRKEEAAFGEYMSKRKCLEEYDRIALLL